MKKSVLMIDPDAGHAAELQHALESIGCGVVVYGDVKSGLEMIGVHRPDLVVVVPRSPAALADTLARVRGGLKQLEHPPEVLFVLRWSPQGPVERLLGARWNTEVLYER